jgi:hypothetical protein
METNLEELVTSVILNIPNFSVAILVVFWQNRMIDKLLENQRVLLERLLNQADESDKTD